MAGIEVCELDVDDVGMLIMAAAAFNMGIGAREDRAPETVVALDNAIRRVVDATGIIFDWGD